MYGLNRDWLLKSVKQGSADVTDSGIDVRSGEATDVVVVLSDHGGSIVGSAHDQAGRPLTDYSVVVFTQSPERLNVRYRYIAIARPDQDGSFHVRGLPEGDYLAIALEAFNPSEDLAPRFFEAARRLAVPVQIVEGVQRELSLKITTLQP